MNIQEKLNYFRIYNTKSIGPVIFKHLIKNFKTATDALANINDYFARFGKKIEVCSESYALNYFEICSKKNIKIVCSFEEAYPKSLLKINDNPPLLYALGNLNLLNKKTVAVIGSRNASLQGKSFASYISKELSMQGVTIVSGMARGIDKAAHEACLNNTIAVMGSGADVVYPAENQDLYDKIKNEGGLILSEVLPEKNPKPEAFSYRNRIISGLSSAVAVIEAAKQSGSLITAEYALEQGKEVFAVPGHPYDQRSSGTNYLIKNGANLLENYHDILNVFNSNAEQGNLFEEIKMVNEEVDDFTVKNWILDQLSCSPVSINLVLKESPYSISATLSGLALLQLSEEILIEGSACSKKCF